MHITPASIFPLNSAYQLHSVSSCHEGLDCNIFSFNNSISNEDSCPINSDDNSVFFLEKTFLNVSEPDS